MSKKHDKQTEQEIKTRYEIQEGGYVDRRTGEFHKAELGEVIHEVTHYPNKRVRIQTNYDLCPTMTEQHTGHLTDINYLIKTYKPDELASYILARNQGRPEIVGHDFSKEPELSEAMNWVVKSKTAFEALPAEIKNQFPNHLEFLKFIDNPQNKEKMLKLGILTEKQAQAISIPENPNKPSDDKQDDVGGRQKGATSKDSSKNATE